MGTTYSKARRNIRKLSESQRYNIHLSHHLVREIFTNNFSSPVHNILEEGWRTRVLDVNAGLGTWLAEMSANYPGCTYIGVNVISDEDGQPFDVDFVYTDIIREGLRYEDNSFDFVIMKLCGWEYSEIEWKDIIIELIRCLKPGGWLELTDFDPNFQNQGPVTIDLFKRISQLEHMKSRNMAIVNKYEEFLMGSNQMQNIQKQTAHLPIGRHGGRLGETALQYYHDLISNYAPRFDMGIPLEDIPELAEKFCEEANTLKIMAPINRVFAQKIS